MEGMLSGRLSSQHLTSSTFGKEALQLSRILQCTKRLYNPQADRDDQSTDVSSWRTSSPYRSCALPAVDCLCLRALCCWIKRGAAFGAQKIATNWRFLIMEHVVGSPQQTERSCLLTEAVVVHPVLLWADTAKSPFDFRYHKVKPRSQPLKGKIQRSDLKSKYKALKLKWNPYFCRCFSCLYLPTAPVRAKWRRCLCRLALRYQKQKRGYTWFYTTVFLEASLSQSYVVYDIGKNLPCKSVGNNMISSAF